MIVEALKNGITNIGRLGENESRVIRFPVDDIIAEFPNCVFSLLHRRKGDPSAYPVPVTRFMVDGGWLYWTVTSGDVGIEGNGKCQIVASEDGKIRKTDTYLTRVDSALDGSGTPPDPWASWQQDVVNAADRAEAAAEFLKNANAEAVELPAGSQPTANYADGTFTFGIVPGPIGATGPVGATGATGAPGVFTDLIDDTAGSDVENRTWSAKKLSEEFSGKADENNPVFTGYISMGRTGSYGNGSVAEGIDVNAQGGGAQAYGKGTIARGNYSQVFGMYNIPDSYESLPEWQPNTHYYVGDKVKRGIVMPPLPARWWMCICKEENEDSSYTPSKWEQHSDGFMRFAEIVGNGVSDNDRSNARRLDWDGNEELAGDLTINKGKANEVSVSELYKKPAGGIPLSDLADNTVSVSGTTPVIAGQAGLRYICGECATLSITAPASGCIDILFESGSTPTVLTITSAKTGVTDIKWMDGFDPDDLDANTIYEINILDGEFGVVAEWT